MIREIEKYVTQGIIQFIHPCSIDSIRVIQSISVESSKRSQTFTSIEEYGIPTFADDIKNITLSYSFEKATNDSKCDIKLTFSRTDYKCDLTISVKDEFSEEKAIGIEHMILKKMAPCRSTTSLYIFIPIIILVAATITLAAGDIINSTFNAHKYHYLLHIGILGLGLIYINNNKGSCTFDSRKQKIKDEWFKWFGTGLASFLFFTTLFFFLRKALYGF